MKSTILILGATGSIGYAVTEKYLSKGIPVTLLVRNRAKAESLFPKNATVEIVEGDAQDGALLKRLAADKSVIFHGINYPYHEWFGNMDLVTQKVIDAAAVNQALIVFPGNVYPFGLATEPIREDSVPNPNTRKGALRVELEHMLQSAAEAGTCRVLNVRLPDFWGPNVLNAGVKPIFEGAITGGKLPWLLDAAIPHQLVYTKDAAEVIVQLSERRPNLPYEVINYGGTTAPSMHSFLQHLAQVAGTSAKVRVYPAWLLKLLGWFQPMMREVVEMLYLYQNSIVLDDSKLRTLLPRFRETPLEHAFSDTLAWFRANR